MNDDARNHEREVYWETSKPKLEKSPISIQHVEGTAFTTEQMVMENEWEILHWEEI
jgi:hypothetical protein